MFIERIAMLFNLFSDIVNLKYDLILLSVEKDLSHLAVLAEFVSEICNNSNRHGKASLSCTSSVTTSLMSSNFLSFKTHLAIIVSEIN